MLQRVGEVAYKLDLPLSCKIHPISHVSQLKRAIGDQPSSLSIPEQLTADLELVVEPEEVLEVKSRTVGNTNQLWVLIKWKHLPQFEAT